MKSTNPHSEHLVSLAYLAGFLVVTIAVGGIIGVSTAPGVWYAGLEKPDFNPPNWIFAPVWGVLYFAIAVAGWRIWSKAPKSATMRVWGAQLLLNWLWSPVFFTMHLLWPALAIIIAIFCLILLFIKRAYKIDALSAYLFVPYAIWVGFATILNVAIAFLN